MSQPVGQLEKQCTHLVFHTKEPRSLKEILLSLEKGSDMQKVIFLKKKIKKKV
jgi:hypothetical protein